MAIDASDAIDWALAMDPPILVELPGGEVTLARTETKELVAA